MEMKIMCFLIEYIKSIIVLMNFHIIDYKKYSQILFGIVALLSMLGCEKTPSPETVVRKWLNFRSAGECNEALKFEREPLPTTQELIVPDCDPYESNIVSLFCTVMEETAECTCIESRRNSGEKKYVYDLKKIDGKWKLTGGF